LRKEVKQMELVRWRPRRDLPVLPEEVDRALDRMVRTWMGPVSFSEFSWSPVVDVSETSDEVVVKAEMPGMSKDDIDISVEDNQLILSGEKRQEQEEKDASYYRVERSYGSFRRIFTLPARVDVAAVKASYQDGILTVRVPKAEAAKAKKIEIS
jgi:HSP20 family protein